MTSPPAARRADAAFSALQRAENSSMQTARALARQHPLFQCSSASRKFLNILGATVSRTADRLSVLFSEPKIPQYRRARRRRR